MSLELESEHPHPLYVAHLARTIAFTFDTQFRPTAVPFEWDPDARPHQQTFAAKSLYTLPVSGALKTLNAPGLLSRANYLEFVIPMLEVALSETQTGFSRVALTVELCNALILRSIQNNDPTMCKSALELLFAEFAHVHFGQDQRLSAPFLDMVDSLNHCYMSSAFDVDGNLLHRMLQCVRSTLPESHFDYSRLLYLEATFDVLAELRRGSNKPERLNFAQSVTLFRESLRKTTDWNPNLHRRAQGLSSALFHRGYAEFGYRESAPDDFQESTCWSTIPQLLFRQRMDDSQRFQLTKEIEDGLNATSEAQALSAAGITQSGLDRLITQVDLAKKLFESNWLFYPLFGPEIYSSGMLYASTLHRRMKWNIKSSGFSDVSRADIDKAVQALRQVENRRISSVVSDPPTRAFSIYLGSALCSQAEHMIQQDDQSVAHTTVDQAIEQLEFACPFAQPQAPNEIPSYGLLAWAYYVRYQITHNPDHTHQSMNAFRSTTTRLAFTDLPRNVYLVALKWATAAIASKLYPSASEAFQVAINNVTRVAWVGHSVRERHVSLKDSAATLGTDAAACALLQGDLTRAIEHLESGRSILFSQATTLRTRFPALANSHPKLMAALEEVGSDIDSRALQFQDTHGVSLAEENDRTSYETQKLRGLGDQWDALVDEIRNIVGWENFLQPPSLSELLGASSKGPVAIIICSRYLEYCHALVILDPNNDAIRLEQLPLLYKDAVQVADLYKETLDIRLNQSRSETDAKAGSRAPVYYTSSGLLPEESLCEVLATLWNEVMSVIIRMIVSHGPQTSDPQQRHLWVSPTGPLSLLPLHAAGIYNDKSSEKQSVSDYCVCSYAPNLSALLNKSSSSATPTHIVAFSGGAGLKHTKEEVNRLASAWGSRARLTRLTESTTLDTVQKNLSQAHVAHFACHGHQDINLPLRSHFSMSDSLNIDLEDLMKAASGNAHLAVLLACETAQGDQALPNEGLHLAGAMLFAGFKASVGTLWSISDADGPEFCAEFYKALLAGEDPDRVDFNRVGLAVHCAVQRLRSNGVSMFRWIPFVHYGV
ncbi:hypothetical protein FRC08_011846 [Ceratobasidium sp. 394]|nr:hypothetical protein FRC08_011846 [Ceratobasidium sp. 394]